MSPPIKGEICYKQVTQVGDCFLTVRHEIARRLRTYRWKLMSTSCDFLLRSSYPMVKRVDTTRIALLLSNITAWRNGVPPSAWPGAAVPRWSVITSSQPLMLLLAVFVYDPLTRIVSLFVDCRAFYHAGPRVWNSLPDELRNFDSSDGFVTILENSSFQR